MQLASYYDGTGLYHDLYDTALSRFPHDPHKDNTTPSQNFMGLIAALYKAYHEDKTPPLDFYKQYISRYNIEHVVQNLVYKILVDAKPNHVSTTLNKLLDEAIFHEYFQKPTPHLIRKLHLLNAFQNTLW